MFPPLGPAAFAELVADIKKHGVRFPITTYEGKCLDGWHRHQACKELGIEPPVKAFRGSDPSAFVFSANKVRRHLNGSQSVLVITALAKSEWATRGGDNKAQKDSMTAEKIAAEAKVSKRTVAKAKKVIVNGSAALNAAVRDGEISISAASEIADLPKKDQAKAIKDAETKEKPDHPATVTWAVHHAVAEELEELRSNYEVMADEVKTQQALLKSDAAAEMLKLREELRVCRRSRDDAMNRAHEMKEQITFWKKQATKLGWKPK